MSNRTENSCTSVMRGSPLNIISNNHQNSATNSNNSVHQVSTQDTSSSTATSTFSLFGFSSFATAGNPQDDFHRAFDDSNNNGGGSGGNSSINNINNSNIVSLPNNSSNVNSIQSRDRYDSFDDDGNMEMTSLLSAVSLPSSSDHRSTPVTSHTGKKSFNNTATNATNRTRSNNNNNNYEGGTNRRLKHRNERHHHQHPSKKNRQRNRTTSDDTTSLESLQATESEEPTNSIANSPNGTTSSGGFFRNRLFCCYRSFKSTLQCMNVLARIVLWCTIIALIVAVVWYSYELHNHGTDAHYIAWFSAGAFVLLGFPISMWGIVGHLANYNQPSVQVYVVRILWMVPIYSIESWLAMRFHKQAIYIETFRDFYESYVLYSFLQFLIEVLGGEENLVLMLKDKSPTRGVHMWGFQWCIKPWLMGQPVRRATSSSNSSHSMASVGSAHLQLSGSGGGGVAALEIPNGSGTNVGGIKICDQSSEEDNNSSTRQAISSTQSGNISTSTMNVVNIGCGGSNGGGGMGNSVNSRSRNHRSTSRSKMHRPKKLVIWESPFFKHCKFGVLQYVLLKLLCAVAVLLLEWKGWYREGHFDWKSGYAYICFLTNLSQCWALYTLIFFYYATKNELSPIRPVGKFISVKALVFFTWWQSVFISCLYQLDMIPKYTDDWTPEHVAKGIQDYLICVEMFVAAVVHVFVFPHSEYSPAAVEARQRAVQNANPSNFYGLEHSGRKRLGRQRLYGHHRNYTRYWKENQGDDVSSKNSNITSLMEDITATHDDIGIANDSLDLHTDLMNVNSTDERYSPPRASSWQDSTGATRLSLARVHSNPLSIATAPQSLPQTYFQPLNSPERAHNVSSDTVATRRTPQNRGSHGFEAVDASPLNNLPSITTSMVGQPQTLKDIMSQQSRHTSRIDPPGWDSSKDDEELAIRMSVPNFQHNYNNMTEMSDVDFRGDSNPSDHCYTDDFSDGSEYSDDDDYDYDDDDDFDRYNNDDNCHHSTTSSKVTSAAATNSNSVTAVVKRPGFVRALLDSAIPLDLRDNTVGIVKGEYHVEKKTLLHHAATSDQYDLFSNRRRVAKQHQQHLQQQQQQLQQQQQQNVVHNYHPKSPKKKQADERLQQV